MYIQSTLFEQETNFSEKTKDHIKRLYETFGYDEMFGRSTVMELLGLKTSGASKLIAKLVQAGVLEPVYGCGKGKYKFRKVKNLNS